VPLILYGIGSVHTPYPLACLRCLGGRWAARGKRGPVERPSKFTAWFEGAESPLEELRVEGYNRYISTGRVSMTQTHKARALTLASSSIKEHHTIVTIDSSQVRDY
jgi:hypothetical protein